MKSSYPLLLLQLQLAMCYDCRNYDFYKKETKKFIEKCGQRSIVSFTKKSAVIDANDFPGDEFNLFFSKMQKFQVCIRIENTKLKKVEFPALREPAEVKCQQLLAAIVIRNNPRLKEIIFGNGTVATTYVPTLMVRGNRKLSRETIDTLNLIKSGARKSKRNSIQMFGECQVPKPLKNLDDLIGCESLHGDIVLKGGTLSPPREPLKKFNHAGCIIVKNTAIENIDFLRNLRIQELPAWICENEILNNPNLCIHEDLERQLRLRIINLNMTIQEDCEMVCMGGTVTPEYIDSTIADRQCKIIRGDVLIQNWKGNTRSLQHFMTVRKINGVLHVLDNTEIKKLDFFVALEEIETDRQEKRPALMISNNSALEEVALISLRRMKSSAPITIVIKNNPNLNVDEEEWYEIAGGENRTMIVLADIVKDEYTWEDIAPMLFKIGAGVAVVVLLSLTALWCAYGTRWNKFSGLARAPVIPAKSRRSPNR